MVKAICSVEGCEGPHKGLGLCNKHFQRLKANGTTEKRPAKQECAGPECARLVSAHQGFGLCRSHYKQMLLGKPLTPLLVATKDLGRPAECIYEGCGRPHKARGYCKAHNELIRKGEALRPIQERQPPGTCCIKDCDKTRHSRGYCTKHYMSLVGRWKMYGISADMGLALWHQQEMACAVCEEPAALHDLSIDHDHSCCPASRGCCGECVRGLLCTACNTGMGQMKDDPRRLRAAAEYIDRASRQLSPLSRINL